jgi:hypothetical protein
MASGRGPVRDLRQAVPCRAKLALSVRHDQIRLAGVTSVVADERSAPRALLEHDPSRPRSCQFWACVISAAS